ncbi:MAG: ABC transporter permease, partial [Dongiaceae bacterium]
MSARGIWNLMLGFYLILFFGYLFGPVIVMGLTAFNTPNYPQVFPYEGFTLGWFGKLVGDGELMEGIWNSVFIGIGVVCVSVPVGLAAAIVMTQVYYRARGLYYLIVVSPVLMPGVILGISTVIFWRGLKDSMGLDAFYNGYWLTILGQSTFISAYAMLV